MKQRGHILDLGAVPSDSTISTFTKCSYDGVEIRIDRCESEVELTVLAYVIQPKFIIANDNYAPEMALAA